MVNQNKPTLEITPATEARPRFPLLQAMRPRQWTKNLFVFAGLFFTLNGAHPASDYLRAGLAFVLFCLLSSAVYLINDVTDVAADRQHPKKRLRPIAAGTLSARTAIVAAVLLAASSLIAAPLTLGIKFTLCAACYFFLTLAYTFALKHMVLVDVFAVASGFVLRAAAGSFAVGVPNSEWLLLCTTLLALFLGFAKRRGELAALGDNPPTRKILADYSLPLLDQLLTIVSAACIMAFALYTFYSRSGTKRPLMMLTLPFVIYGLFRYLYLVQRRGEGEAPEMVLLTDNPTRVNVLLFMVVALLVILTTR